MYFIYFLIDYNVYSEADMSMEIVTGEGTTCNIPAEYVNRSCSDMDVDLNTSKIFKLYQMFNMNIKYFKVITLVVIMLTYLDKNNTFKSII